MERPEVEHRHPPPASETTIETDIGAAASDSTDAHRAGRFDPVALGLLAAALLYAGLTIDRGWIPHDDGMLGQSAVRVLTGELPHRDFQDMYSGGLSYGNALAFALFGIHLLAPRLLLLASFVGFAAVSFSLGRRFAGQRAAAAVVLLGTIWGMPNYPAAMPTWYNLFLAALALWCVFRFLDTDRRRWLVAAGAACGVSMSIKIVGVYTLAAVLIGLALVEAEPRGAHGEAGRSGGARVYAAAVAAGLCAYFVLVLALIRAHLDLASLVHFAVPSLALVGVAAWRIARAPVDGDAASRLNRLARLVAPVLLGVALPIALLLVPYVASGSVGALVDGVFVLPFRRPSLAATSSLPLPLTTFAPALVPLTLGVLAATGPQRLRRGALAAFAVALAVVLILGGRDRVYPAVWGGLLLLPVLLTVAVMLGAWRTWRRPGTPTRPPLEAALAALVLGTFTLVQYPYSGPIYFFYLAPLVALVALAGTSMAPAGARAPALVLLVFTLLFGARWVATADLFATAQGRYAARPPLERMELDRGHIRLPASERAEYEALAEALRELSAGTGVTFVTPDAPEAYFLSGLRNPTPFFYDFLDDPAGRTARILTTLERADVRVIALNRAPSLSGPPPPDLVAELERRFPSAAILGRFVVRWR
ncbi:MAG: glycosyltransferase family 39 protein [Longimicrobiales bacterium]